MISSQNASCPNTTTNILPCHLIDIADNLRYHDQLGDAL